MAQPPSPSYSAAWRQDQHSSLPSFPSHLPVKKQSPTKQQRPQQQQQRPATAHAPPIGSPGRVLSSTTLGFNSSSVRVVEKSNGLPPPGLYYTKLLADLANSRSPSISNRGYVSGFVSTDPHERNASFVKRSETANVDFFDPPHADRRTMNRSGHAYPFLGAPQERVPHVEWVSQRDVPGPAKYDADGHYDSRGPRFLHHSPDASFKSMSNRRSFLHDALLRSNSPGPANYEVARPQTPSSAVWSRSGVPRFGNQPAPATGAGSPEDGPLGSPTSVAHGPSSPVVRSRSAGSVRTSIIKGKLFERPSSPVKHFGSEPGRGSDNPRSMFGNLAEQAETPGPAQYVLTSFVDDEPEYSKQHPTSAFRSESPGHPLHTRRGPGPLLYRPTPAYKIQKVAIQNLDGRWL